MMHTIFFLFYLFIVNFPLNGEAYTPTIIKVIERQHCAIVYHYNQQKLIQAIEHYERNQTEERLYRREQLFWDCRQDSSYLISRVMEDAEGQVVSCDCFFYNARGQLIRESIVGNLSGLCSSPLLIQSNGYPIENGIESYHKYYTYSDDDQNLLLSEKEDNGSVTLYHYDPKTKQCTAKLKGSSAGIISRCFYLYDDQGFLHQTIIDDGHTFDYLNLIGVTQRQIIDSQMNEEGQPLLNQTFYWNPHTQQNCLLEKTIFSYGSKGELLQQDFYDGEHTLLYNIHYHYDDKGQLVATVDSRREEALDKEPPHQEKFDSWNQRIATIDPYGNETKYGYDSFGRLQAIQLPQVFNEQDNAYHPITVFSYDVLDQVITTLDPQGYLIKTTYNRRGQPLTIDYPDGSQEKYLYFLDGEIKQKFNRDSTYFLYTRDGFCRLVCSAKYTKDHELIQQLFYSYQGERIHQFTDGCTFTFTYEYDGAGREIGTIHETGDGKRRVQWTYNAQGEKTNICEWFGIGENEFVIKKESKASNPVDQSAIHFHSSQTQNALGQTVKQEEWIAPDGLRQVCVYDALQRVESCTKWNSFNIKISEQKNRYDANGHLTYECHTVLIQGIPHSSFIIRRMYDCSDHLLSVSEQTATFIQTTTYHYQNQQVARVIKPSGVMLDYCYNSKGQLIRWFASDQSLDYSYVYNKEGYLVACHDHCQQMTQTYQYNAFGDLVKDQQSPFFTIQYTYDQAGRRTKLILPDETAISYQYTQSLLTDVHRLNADQSLRYTHSYTYNAQDQLQTSRLINQLGEIHYQRENPLSVTIHSPWWSQKIDRKSEGFFSRAVKLQMTDSLGSYVSHCVYGDEGALVQQDEEHYTYDSLYNRLSVNDEKFDINDRNQLIKQGPQILKYDLNGCLIEYTNEKGTPLQLRYDAADRLIQIQQGDTWVINYWYDAHHRRLGRRLKQGNSENVTYFMYDKQDEIGELKANGEVTALRVLGRPLGSEGGGAVALELGQKNYAPIHDWQGSICCLVDSQANKIAEFYRYQAFGTETIYNENNQKIEHSVIGNPWRYAEKRKDDLSTFIYFGRRDYAPNLARWMTPDPLFHKDTANVYAYVKNDPIHYRDEYGLFSMRAAWNFATSCLSNGFEYLRRSSHQFRSRLNAELGLPPSVTQAFKKIGKSILGEPNYLLIGYEKENTQISYFGKQELSDKVRVTFINGMLTTNSVMLQNLELISESHGGVKIHYVFRPTEGWTWDVLRGIHVRMLYHVGLRSTHTRLLAKMWKVLIQEMGGVDGGGVIIHYAHSLGGTETDRARQLLSPEEQQMIRVVTLGSSTMIRNEGFQSVNNMVSVNDGVSILLEPFGGLRNLFDPHTNITYHSTFFSFPCFPFDHLMNGSTYSTLIKQFGEQFLAEFN